MLVAEWIVEEAKNRSGEPIRSPLQISYEDRIRTEVKVVKVVRVMVSPEGAHELVCKLMSMLLKICSSFHSFIQSILFGLRLHVKHYSNKTVVTKSLAVKELTHLWGRQKQ